MCVCYFRLQRTEFEVAGGCHTCYICVTTFFLLSWNKRKRQRNKETNKNLVIRWISKIMTWQFIVGGISILLLREGGVPVGGGGRWMRKSVIISIVYPPTTPAFSHPSFPKEGNGDTTDLLNDHQIWRRIRSVTEARLTDKKVVRGNHAGGCGMGRYMCYSYIGLYRVI